MLVMQSTSESLSDWRENLDLNNVIDTENELIEQSQKSDLPVQFEVNNSIPEPTTMIEFPTSQMCFIGDSRTVGMKNAMMTDAQFIAKESVGLTWFHDEARPAFDQIKNNIEICAVSLGINDLANVDTYIAELNSFADTYPDKIFVYINVAPIKESDSTQIKNQQIEEFNQKMKDGLSENWQIIDQYGYATKYGYDMAADGIHYSSEQYAKTFAWLVDELKSQSVTIS